MPFEATNSVTAATVNEGRRFGGGPRREGLGLNQGSSDGKELGPWTQRAVGDGGRPASVTERTGREGLGRERQEWLPGPAAEQVDGGGAALREEESELRHVQTGVPLRLFRRQVA